MIFPALISLLGAYILMDKDKTYAKGGSTLLAPNGKPSNLTPEQWKLVRTPEFKAWFGDWENDPKNASKVVDENSEPLVVYHGTLKGGFNIFNVGKISDDEWNNIWSSQFRSGADPTAYLGSHFSKEKKVAELFMKGLYAHKGNNPMIYECFLKIKNIIITSEDKLTEDLYSQNAIDNLAVEREITFDDEVYLEEKYGTKNTDKIYKSYKKNKADRIDINTNALQTDSSDAISLASQLAEEYKNKLSKKIDGIQYGNKMEGGTSYIVFQPNQIKLADGSNTTFDADNPDIRYNEGGEAQM